jgi:threonine aldolase
VIDLRSDTVTKPSAEMRRVMADAPVGDDVAGEDPSINALQEKAAALLGKEAALFVPTGTMANQIAAKVHTTPTNEIILAENSHLFTAECGAVAMISGASLSLVKVASGILDAKMVAAAIRSDNLHCPRSRVVWLENTHNFGGGTVYPVQTVKELSQLAHSRGMVLHMDGARLFNAAIAAGASARDYAAHCDTVNFCLSKGLGCPVGSLIAGSKAVIDEARRWRKALGGGMRQAGIVAAAGIYALDHNIGRLVEDHANAKILANALAGHKLVKLNPAEVVTNIVMPSFAEPVTSDALIKAAAKEGVLFFSRGPHAIRLVTHLDVSKKDCEKAAEILLRILDRFAA